MADPMTRQARRMYAVVSELLRRYQFRDRDQICCHGLSVSQCYTLELLADGGPRTMGELAGEICLKISTATRVVDQLVAAGLAERRNDPRDRRVCCVEITQAGRGLVGRIRDQVIAEYEVVLGAVPAASRGDVIDALVRLLSAFKQRQCGDAVGRACDAAIDAPRRGSGRRPGRRARSP